MMVKENPETPDLETLYANVVDAMDEIDNVLNLIHMARLAGAVAPKLLDRFEEANRKGNEAIDAWLVAVRAETKKE